MYLPDSLNTTIALLSDQQVGTLLRHVLATMRGEESSLDDQVLAFAARGIFWELEQEKERKAGISAKRRAAINSRWNTNDTNDTNDTNEYKSIQNIQMNTNVSFVEPSSDYKGENGESVDNERVSKSADDKFDDALLDAQGEDVGEPQETDEESNPAPLTYPSLLKEGDKEPLKEKDTPYGVCKKKSSPTAPEKKTSGTYKVEDFISDLMSVGVEEGTAQDWMAVRKEKKLAPTKTAFQGTVREMKKIPEKSFEELIRFAIEKGWGGFMESYYRNAMLQERTMSRRAATDIRDVNDKFDDTVYEY